MIVSLLLFFTASSLHHAGGEDHLCQVDFSLLCDLQQNVCCEPLMVNKKFEKCAHYILAQFNLETPTCVEEATKIYFQIISYIDEQCH